MYNMRYMLKYSNNNNCWHLKGQTDGREHGRPEGEEDGAVFTEKQK